MSYVRVGSWCFIAHEHCCGCNCHVFLIVCAVVHAIAGLFVGCVGHVGREMCRQQRRSYGEFVGRPRGRVRTRYRVVRCQFCTDS
jgi:hypothetical protein